MPHEREKPDSQENLREEIIDATLSFDRIVDFIGNRPVTTTEALLRLPDDPKDKSERKDIESLPAKIEELLANDHVVVINNGAANERIGLRKKETGVEMLVMQKLRSGNTQSPKGDLYPAPNPQAYISFANPKFAAETGMDGSFTFSIEDDTSSGHVLSVCIKKDTLSIVSARVSIVEESFLDRHNIVISDFVADRENHELWNALDDLPDKFKHPRDTHSRYVIKSEIRPSDRGPYTLHSTKFTDNTALLVQVPSGFSGIMGMIPIKYSE